MHKYILGLLTLLVILGLSCAPSTTAGQSSNAQIVIQMPDSINPPLFSIYPNAGTSTATPLNTSTLDQNSIRYEVIVQSSGHRLSDTILNKSDKKAISVISGIPLDIFVGVYYATGSSSNEEQYNVFLASGSVTGFEIMSGESKNINLTLNLTNKQPVDTYFDTSIFGAKGFAEITGGVIYTTPFFSVKAYNSINSNIINYFSNSLNIFFPLGLTTISGRGVLDVFSNLSTAYVSPSYWFLQQSGLSYDSQIINISGPSFIPGPTASQNANLLGNSISMKNISISSNNYIFIIHHNGFFSTYSTGGFFGANLIFTDTSNFNSNYPADPFLLDVQSDSTNNTMAFFATKQGLFYIDQPTLTNYSSGNFSTALDASKKLILILNSNRIVLITNVADAGNRVYLGTKQGIYYIDKNSSSWNSFKNASNSTFTLFDTGSINKLALNDPIEKLVILNTPSGNILVASTPNQIYYFNTSDSKSASITVWDGFPFIPAYGVSGPSYNANEYYVHNMAPVNAVIWDSTNLKFWFATTYGLASVNLSSLGL